MNKMLRLLTIVALLAVSFVAPTAFSAQNSGLVAPLATEWTNPYHFVTASGTNSTLVVAGTPTLFAVTSINPNTAVYLKIYDSATAPTCGSGHPITTIEIGGSATGFKRIVLASLKAGLSFCVTGALADTDTTSVTSAQVIDFYYK